MSEAYRVLGTAFESAAALEREWNANLVKGGVFVPGRFELLQGEPVLVFVDLPFARTALELEGRVVHCVPPEFQDSGGHCGVAVELRASPRQLSARIETLLGLRFDPELDRRGQGGRAAPRAVAHLRVRVRTRAGGEIEGRTRNLSLAGVLIALPGEAPAVGEPVVVCIVHGPSGEERPIPGVVARHERDEAGAVRGIGVRFVIEGPEARETEAHLARIRASEHARRLGAITGSLETLGVADLLSSFGRCVPRGRFTFVCDGRIGTVQVEGGRLHSARLADEVGLEALACMLAWTSGQFELHPNASPEPGPGILELPVEAALLEAARRLDEDRSAGPGRRASASEGRIAREARLDA